MKCVKHQTIPVDTRPRERGSAALRPLLYVYTKPNKPGLLVMRLADGVEQGSRRIFSYLAIGRHDRVIER